ncbi:methylmalonate-semialdehyde dehydrogenase [Shewanella sp. HN-41]|nr:methylmalonate-semialdehyde dehydrogenase [Shewanella sp. HN-41]
MTTQVKHYIDGEFIQGTGTSQIIVTNPANNSPIAVINAATSDEVHAAIASAKLAFKTWKEVPVSERARVMLRYQHLLKEHHDELATILAKEPVKPSKMPRAMYGAVSKSLNTPVTWRHY